MITTISTLPAVPNRNDPATFSEKADALLGAMPTLVTELNSFVTEVNTLSFKSACKCATTSNINLNTQGTSTTGIDGAVTLQVGDRVLVRIQNNSAENGIYAVGSTAWTRAADMDTPAEVAGSFVPITFGTTFGGKIFYTTFNATGATLGVTSIPWNSLTDATITGVGTLSAANGGTGNSSYSVGDLLYASGATTLTKLAAAASGNVLKSGTAPSWGKVALASDVSGTLPVANGGTGLNSVGASFGLYLTSDGTGGWAAATLPGASTVASGTTQFATDAELDTNQAPVSNRSVTVAGLRTYAPLRANTSLAASTLSGTNWFLNTPTWANRITISLSGVSTFADDSLLVQLGTSAGFLTTGYVSDAAGTNGTAGGWVSATSGFIIRQPGAAGSASGHVLLTHLTGNIWVSSHTITTENSGVICIGGGTIALPGQLDRVRLTTFGGTTTFDTGYINFIYG